MVTRLHAIRYAEAPVRDGVRRDPITEAKLHLSAFCRGGALRTPSLKTPAEGVEFYEASRLHQAASGGVGSRAPTVAGLFGASRPPLFLQNVDACLVHARVTARLESALLGRIGCRARLMDRGARHGPAGTLWDRRTVRETSGDQRCGGNLECRDRAGPQIP
ncbi:hypothetical protein HYPSUDRAFT_199407 [Hypholoma sublateritium FD-334 SS-4]|uniref:Uncharacterized protein n=1 Tax=Hypholoma sublateritium (strain FD-334 SS-4) TaxID=945553 RepID=A0A0D2P496_HYPSF|nr:hypothetical protein HYPSUDRAFT_199407 [Hypholoma sublateritium FD-334 SS-4]